MKIHDCKAVRREIDEAQLDAALTIEAVEHLGNCGECQRFHAEGLRLRGLMAELGTVGAPPDFDFRLRARLAREKPHPAFGYPLLTARLVAAVALAVLVAMTAAIIGSRFRSAVPPVVASQRLPQDGGTPARRDQTATLQAVPEITKSTADHTAVSKPALTVPAVRRDRGRAAKAVPRRVTNPAAGGARQFTTRDSAGTAAAEITPESAVALVVVPVDQRPFTVSIDNGRGGSRTISLPPVSFGSQRLLDREASFTPISAVKGDW